MAQFYNAKLASSPNSFQTDICIIGAGATGLAMAVDLSKQSQKRILIVESGGESPEVATQSLNEMQVKGMPLSNPPEISRMRFLGGSTNCWGGWSRLVSPDVVSQWPLDYAELKSYIPMTNKILKLKDGNFDQPYDWYRFDDQYQLKWGEDLEVGIRQIRAERLWPTYKKELSESKNVNVLFNANAYNVKFKADNETIESLTCKSLDGKEITVKANKFVLACGGLENPVLLLNFDRLNQGLLSRKTNLIGRYYSDHHESTMYFYPLSCFMPAFKNFHEVQEDGQKMYHWVRMFFSLNKKKYPEIKMPAALSFSFHPQCTHRTQWDYENIYDKITLRDSNFDLKQKKDNEDALIREDHAAVLYAPSANINNKIELSDQLLAHGHYKANLHYNLLPEDIEELKKINTIFETVMRKNGFARLKLGDFQLYDRGNPKTYHNGRHHMGGTRMGKNATDGVVDSNLKMFGTKNLYIVGSGVFPTFDWMGPTYTAVALSLRLAKHLVKN